MPRIPKTKAGSKSLKSETQVQSPQAKSQETTIWESLGSIHESREGAHQSTQVFQTNTPSPSVWLTHPSSSVPCEERGGRAASLRAASLTSFMPPLLCSLHPRIRQGRQSALSEEVWSLSSLLALCSWSTPAGGYSPSQLPDSPGTASFSFPGLYTRSDRPRHPPSDSPSSNSSSSEPGFNEAITSTEVFFYISFSSPLFPFLPEGLGVVALESPPLCWLLSLNSKVIRGFGWYSLLGWTDVSFILLENEQLLIWTSNWKQSNSNPLRPIKEKWWGLFCIFITSKSTDMALSILPTTWCKPLPDYWTQPSSFFWPYKS